MLEYIQVHLLHAVTALNDDNKSAVMGLLYGIVAKKLCGHGTINYIEPGNNFMKIFSSHYDPTTVSKVRQFFYIFIQKKQCLEQSIGQHYYLC